VHAFLTDLRKEKTVQHQAQQVQQRWQVWHAGESGSWCGTWLHTVTNNTAFVIICGPSHWWMMRSVGLMGAAYDAQLDTGVNKQRETDGVLLALKKPLHAIDWIKHLHT
jgi:hypothetical protein